MRCFQPNEKGEVLYSVVRSRESGGFGLVACTCRIRGVCGRVKAHVLLQSLRGRWGKERK